jgi:tRNA-dihydrouridine synthase
VAQVFGANLENMKKACQYIAGLGFDGIDINMGCPDKSVISQGAGSALIKTPALAREIIRAAKEGAQGLPLSVKTRIGYNLFDVNWIKTLLGEDLAALTVHLRTRKEMSDVPAHWELMSAIIKIRNEISPKTLIIGNGDVADLKDAESKVLEYGCDGVMIGRGVFGNPWFFSSLRSEHISKSNLSGAAAGAFFSARQPAKGFSQYVPSLQEKLKVLIEHTQIFEKKLLLPKHKNFAVMKKHFKAYVNGFAGAKELRVKLMETKNAKQVEKIINDFLLKMG